MKATGKYAATNRLVQRFTADDARRATGRFMTTLKAWQARLSSAARDGAPFTAVVVARNPARPGEALRRSLATLQPW